MPHQQKRLCLVAVRLRSNSSLGWCLQECWLGLKAQSSLLVLTAGPQGHLQGHPNLEVTPDKQEG